MDHLKTEKDGNATQASLRVHSQQRGREKERADCVGPYNNNKPEMVACFRQHCDSLSTANPMRLQITHHVRLSLSRLRATFARRCVPYSRYCAFEFSRRRKGSSKKRQQAVTETREVFQIQNETVITKNANYDKHALVIRGKHAEFNLLRNRATATRTCSINSIQQLRNSTTMLSNIKRTRQCK